MRKGARSCGTLVTLSCSGGLPPLDDYDPNNQWFQCYINDCNGGFNCFWNPGVQYSSPTSSEFDWKKVEYRCKRCRNFTDSELDEIELKTERMAEAAWARQWDAKIKFAETVDKFESGWHPGVSLMYDVRDQCNWYIHFDVKSGNKGSEGAKGKDEVGKQKKSASVEPNVYEWLHMDIIFSQGDFIMMKGLPISESYDPNNKWFECYSMSHDIPHFINKDKAKLHWKKNRRKAETQVYFRMKRGKDAKGNPNTAQTALEKAEKMYAKRIDDRLREMRREREKLRAGLARSQNAKADPKLSDVPAKQSNAQQPEHRDKPVDTDDVQNPD
eukprot:jgi/Bigna1/143080/aug1.75_g17788